MSRAAAFVVLAFGAAPAALAQSSQLALPQEFPPASYTSNQYVDSTGCAFLRAGLSGAITWVPRVNRDRTPLCGFQPSLASASTTIAENAAAIANAPVITIDTPTVTPTVTPIAAAEVGMPMETVASLTTPPRSSIPQPVSPRIIEAPAPAISLAPVAPQSPAAIPRMTMAQICADMDATGRRYMNAETGITVRCGPQLQPVSTVAPAGLAQSAAPALVNLNGQIITIAQLCQLSDATGNRYLTAATGIPVQCGPQIESPSRITAPLGQSPVAQAQVPSSPVVTPPAGYVAVWDDGRLNPHRGLPEGNAQAVVAPVTTNVSAMNLPQPAATGHLYVQVGTFSEMANADRTADLLRSLGFPIGFATVTRNGTRMRVVAAGPFADPTSLRAALQAARAAGFSDAFSRS